MKTMFFAMLKPERCGVGGTRWFIQVGDTTHITTLLECGAVMNFHGVVNVDYTVVPISTEDAQLRLRLETNLRCEGR